MKIGIVVPYSWSFLGAVIEHAQYQAEALAELGHDVRVLCANDPPGTFTRFLHPRSGRHDAPPPYVIPVGRSVIVPANGSLPNISLSPSALPRVRAALRRERFDVLHLHEPMTPVICTATLAIARTPIVATFHAAGGLRWNDYARAHLGIPDRARRPPDRGLRAGRGVGGKVVSRRVRDRPQRRADPARGRSGQPPRPRRLRGSGRAAQGAARAAARVAPGASGDGRPAAADRSGSARGQAPLRARAAVPRRYRRARPGRPGSAERRAALCQGAGRPVARRRELRHGADARLRVRDPRRRVGHLRIP